MSKDRHEVGGVYLFKDESSLQVFLQGELFASVKSNPAFKDLGVKQFSILTDPFSIFSRLEHPPEHLNVICMPLRPMEQFLCSSEFSSEDILTKQALTQPRTTTIDPIQLEQSQHALQFQNTYDLLCAG